MTFFSEVFIDWNERCIGHCYGSNFDHGILLVVGVEGSFCDISCHEFERQNFCLVLQLALLLEMPKWVNFSGINERPNFSCRQSPFEIVVTHESHGRSHAPLTGR